MAHVGRDAWSQPRADSSRLSDLCGSGYHSGVEFVTFLFGSGWWIAWHLFILGSAVPMLFALRWLRTMRTGEGPQGGEAAFVVLVGIALTLIAATVIDAALLGWKLADVLGAMWGTIAGLVFCTLWTVILFASAKRFMAPSDESTQTALPALIIFGAWHAGLVVANLLVLARIHG